MAVYSPEDQRARRRRARVTQADVAGRLNISEGAVSQYEVGPPKKRGKLPWGLTPDDYERALAAAVTDKNAPPKKGRAA